MAREKKIGYHGRRAKLLPKYEKEHANHNDKQKIYIYTVLRHFGNNALKIPDLNYRNSVCALMLEVAPLVSLINLNKYVIFNFLKSSKVH